MQETESKQTRSELKDGGHEVQEGPSKEVAASAVDHASHESTDPNGEIAAGPPPPVAAAAAAAATKASHKSPPPCQSKDTEQLAGASNSLSKETRDSGVDFSVQPLPNGGDAAPARQRLPGAYAEGGPAPLSIRDRLDDMNNSGVGSARSSRTGSISTMDLSLFETPISELAVASLVSQKRKDLPLAEEMDLEGGDWANGRKSSHTDNRHRRIVTYCLLGGIALVLSGFTILLVFLTRNIKTTGPEPFSSNMTNATESLSVRDHVASLLPDFTVEALADPTSPQASAMEWILKDPALENNIANASMLPYPDWRVLQRFTLASFYFSTGGPDLWYNNDYWLSYNVSECFWFANSIVMGHSLKNASTHVHQTAGCDVLKGDNVFRHVWLFANGLEGKLPEEFFFGLPHLRNIYLWTNNLEGTLPPRIGRLSSLRNIHLTRTHIGGSLPTELGLLTTLASLQLFGTQVYGTVPTELARLKNLTWLDLSQNVLTGNLPTELGLLESVEKLFAATNNLDGPIPSEFGALESLLELDLHGNDLTGSITAFESAFQKTSSLQSLDVSQNFLTGSLPSALELLVNLTTLLAQENQLTGSIPSLFGSSLATLNVTGNLLSGSIEDSLCFIESFGFDCNENLCGCNCSCASSP